MYHLKREPYWSLCLWLSMPQIELVSNWGTLYWFVVQVKCAFYSPSYQPNFTSSNVGITCYLLLKLHVYLNTCILLFCNRCYQNSKYLINIITYMLELFYATYVLSKIAYKLEIPDTFVIVFFQHFSNIFHPSLYHILQVQ